MSTECIICYESKHKERMCSKANVTILLTDIVEKAGISSMQTKGQTKAFKGTQGIGLSIYILLVGYDPM